MTSIMIVNPKMMENKVEIQGLNPFLGFKDSGVLLWSNDKPNTNELLDAVEQYFKKNYPTTRVKRVLKGNASVPASEEFLSSAVEGVSCAIVAMGD